MTLVDAGPLLALVDKAQPKHQSCREAAAKLPKPFITTWACITEAMHLSYRRGGWVMQKQLGKLITEGLLTVFEIQQTNYNRLFQLMEKYRDCPMDFADATLVLAAEQLATNQILTLDADFYVYRIDGSESFNVVQLD